MRSNASATITVFLSTLLEDPKTLPYWIATLLWPLILAYSVAINPINLMEVELSFASYPTTTLLFLIAGLGTIFDILRGELQYSPKADIIMELPIVAVTIFNLNYIAVGLVRLELMQTELFQLLAEYAGTPAHYMYAVPALATIAIIVRLFRL